ncbi:MAG: Alpha-glucoside transport system permease protein AglG, partial [uncultured Nocardioides sp.]
DRRRHTSGSRRHRSWGTTPEGDPQPGRLVHLPRPRRGGAPLGPPDAGDRAHVVPQPGRRRGGGLVAAVPPTVPVRRPQLRQLPARGAGHQPGRGVRQQPRDRVAGDLHPHPGRRVRGLRLHVHEVPGPRRPLRGHRRDAGGAELRVLRAGAAHLPRPRHGRHVPSRVAVPRRLRHGSGDLHDPQLHGHAALHDHRVRQDRRGQSLPDVLPAGAPDVRAGPGVVRDLPVPLGLERPAGRPRVPRPGRQGADDRVDLPAARTAGPEPGARDGVRHVLHDRADHRVPLAAALLRARPHRGCRQGL